MGLLDEAIREHLELKRRRGADPSSIAREEREALAPVFPDEPAGDGVDPSHDDPESAPAATIVPAVAVPAAVVPASARPAADQDPADLSPMGQETAELDMQAVMKADLDADDAPSTADPFMDAHTPSERGGEAIAEDSLDWGFPGDREREPPPEDIPGQERLSFE